MRLNSFAQTPTLRSGITEFGGTCHLSPIASSETDAYLVRPGGVPTSIKLKAELEQPNQSPLVSCLMVTRGNIPILQYSLECYLRQTYTNRELVIVSDSTSTEFWEYLKSFDGAAVRPVGAPKASLGELRNLSVAQAKGELLCQWDDDDLYDPLRLSRSVQALLASGAAAVFLAHWLMWWPSKELLAISKFKIWQGSMITWRHILPTYPDLARHEDLVVTSQIKAANDIVLLNDPYLYCYTITGLNTFGERHFELLFQNQTQCVYRDQDYWKELAVLGKRTPALAYAAALGNMRPRAGFRDHSLAEVVRRRAMLHLVCPLCGRQGQYPVNRLINQFGPDITLYDLRYKLARCPFWGDVFQPCQIDYANPFDG